MNRTELAQELRREGLRALDAAEWAAIAPELDVVSSRPTFVAGELLVVRTEAGLAAVEAPDEGRRVVRLLGDEEAAEAFVRDRLATYERMWDGCGCRIDYYEPAHGRPTSTL